MSKGFITGTNEELIKAYKESRDESSLREILRSRDLEQRVALRLHTSISLRILVRWRSQSLRT